MVKKDKEHMRKLTNQINAIDFKTDMAVAITEADVDSVIEAFGYSEIEIVHVAARIITNFSKENIMKVLSKFSTYNPISQVILIPTLGTLNHYQVYEFMFNLLEETKKEAFSNLIVEVLAKTDYFVFPMVFWHSV